MGTGKYAATQIVIDVTRYLVVVRSKNGTVSTLQRFRPFA